MSCSLGLHPLASAGTTLCRLPRLRRSFWPGRRLLLLAGLLPAVVLLLLTGPGGCMGLRSCMGLLHGAAALRPCARYRLLCRLLCCCFCARAAGCIVDKHVRAAVTDGCCVGYISCIHYY